MASCECGEKDCLVVTTEDVLICKTCLLTLNTEMCTRLFKLRQYLSGMSGSWRGICKQMVDTVSAETTDKETDMMAGGIAAYKRCAADLDKAVEIINKEIKGRNSDSDPS